MLNNVKTGALLMSSVLLLLTKCTKENEDSDPNENLRDRCSIAWGSPDDAYLRIINTLDVNIYIMYEDLPYSAHMWANSCEMMGVFADTRSAITIQRCESAAKDPDGGPADCSNSGPVVRVSYNLEASETEEVLVDEDFFN